MKIIGIAGGSGSGKSTVSYALVDAEPALFEVVNLDDYQKLKSTSNLPMINGKINWDHPDIINWDDLLADITKLQAGKSITVNVWSHRSNPDYHKHRTMLPRTIQPRPIMIVEGYLASYHPKLNELYSRTYYLDLDDAVRTARRGKNNVIGGRDYVNEVLIPMHKKYVEPTKKHAQKVIDVSTLTVERVVERIRADVRDELKL